MCAHTHIHTRAAVLVYVLGTGMPGIFPQLWDRYGAGWEPGLLGSLTAAGGFMGGGGRICEEGAGYLGSNNLCWRARELLCLSASWLGCE